MNELHRVIGDVAILPHVINGDDVGVVQSRRSACLAAKPLERAGASPGAEHDLQRHVAAQRELLGLVDDSHAAAADLTQNPVVANLARNLRP